MRRGIRAVQLSSLLMAAMTAVSACGGGDGAADADVEGGAMVEAPRPSFGGAVDGDADLVEMEDYELTMEDVRRWAEAERNVRRAAAADPRVEAALDPEESFDDGVESLDATEARIESVPEARDAVEAAGLTAREYALIFWVMFQTGMADFALKEGADTTEITTELRINPANLRFLEENRAEITQLRQQLQEDGG